MAGKLISVANMKGGVGKTTTVVMLAEALAADKASVLVVDLDPQASASVCFAGDELLAELITQGRTLDAFLAQRLITREVTKLEAKIRPGASATTQAGKALDVSLLPSGPHLRHIEREIIYELTGHGQSMRGVEDRLWKLFQADFEPLARRFDYVIFDCAPGISPLTEVAIRSSDLVVVPTIPDFLSTSGLNAFYQSIWKSPAGRGALPKPKQLPYVLVARWQQGVKQHQRTLASLEAEAAADDPGFRLFKTRIPQAAGLASALVPGNRPTFQQKYSAALVANVIAPLIGELKEALNGH